MNVSFAVIAAGAMTIAATPLAAADLAPRVVVSYADLDIANRAGIATLEHRVAAAARRVCDTGAGIGDGARARACRSSAVAAAMGTFRATHVLYAAR